MTTKVTKPVLLAEAEAALAWSTNSEFSAHITPPQSQALLTELDRLRECREALRKIAAAGERFDAKGAHSKQVVAIAREALAK